MKALRHLEWKSRPVWQDVAIPEPKQGEVLIKMAGAGICHSDLHLIGEYDATTFPQMQPPFTIGHENAGIVEKLGEGACGVEVGQAVVVVPLAGCGHCEYCHSDNEAYCAQIQTIGNSPGLGRDGGMAEYMIVSNSRHLVPIGDLDPALAAPMTDAGMTSYHVVRKAAPKLNPTATALVIGIGGLGHMALQFLRELTSATIIAVDANPESLVLAKKLGATHCIPSDAQTAAKVKELTGGLGANVVFDFVGIQPTMDMCQQAVRTMGEIYVAGLGGGSFTWAAGMFPWETPVYSHLGGTHQDVREVVALLQNKKVEAEITKFHLSDALKALDELKDGKITGRAVLLPDDASL